MKKRHLIRIDEDGNIVLIKTHRQVALAAIRRSLRTDPSMNNLTSDVAADLYRWLPFDHWDREIVHRVILSLT